MGQLGQQSCSASRTAALYGPGRYIEDLSGFRDGIALHIDQDQSNPLFGRQGSYGLDELAVKVLPFCGFLGGLMGFEKLIQTLGIVDR
jgi:hypothetical protein